MSRRAAKLLLFAAMTFVWFTVLLPNTGLSRLRSHWQALSSAISWVEGLYPPLDMVHVVLFFGLGLLLALSLHARRAVQLVLIVVLAAATELAQVWVPGRSAKFSDFAVDIGGGSAGLMAGWILIYILVKLRVAWRRSSKPTSRDQRQQE